ncbi:MAG TPA: hypothetical protein VOB72_21530 [Candidatus Dormibacteraeota bacterium]|nr:hypothetical protein [Candidatus Dormibacteraeota bacterium]
MVGLFDEQACAHPERDHVMNDSGKIVERHLLARLTGKRDTVH